YPPLYPPITHPQNPAIPREWLENVERELAGIHSYAGAIAGTLAAEGNVDFNRYRGNRNLTTIFPFSIPFSFGRAISSLRAPPQAPRFEADFTGTVFDSNTIAQAHGIPTSGAGGFVLTLDLEEFESLAVIIRWGVWITFFVGLMLLTNKLIRW
ncbi:MAG: hypothetical protein FWC16_12875, partial [Defluviitaleaceae bacterium]|nr:hypothetical protein [Defluviitaleaceae bacterium]MCL2275813.1 hypothetical protein [Defluviitaleaceae bacterium]